VGLLSFLGAEGVSVKSMTVHASGIAARDGANAIPVEIRAKRTGVYRIFFKRILDILFVLAAAPFVIPFVFVTSILISLDGHTPFFRQERVGKDGRRFMMWKFRTMVPDAEQLLEQHLSENPKARQEWDSKQKLTADPRCTAIGRVLRRTSMDELPQLFNVLGGDMSLIGPRPMMPSQQALYPGHSYYNLRPGVTGPWQVSARHASEFSARAHYDDLYDATMSFAQDVGILIRTVGVVIRGTGV
jgi:exopolysaccharide production protein ExoY